MQADIFIAQRTNANNSLEKVQDTITQISEILRIYFDFEAIVHENVAAEQIQEWTEKTRDLEAHWTTKNEPLASEVASFYRQLREYVTQL